MHCIFQHAACINQEAQECHCIQLCIIIACPITQASGSDSVLLAAHAIPAVQKHSCILCRAQALASERELFVSLFGDEGLPNAAPSMEASRMPQSSLMPTSSNASHMGSVRGSDGGAPLGDMPDTAAMLDRVFESICRPLKVGTVQPRLAACQCTVALLA